MEDVLDNEYLDELTSVALFLPETKSRRDQEALETEELLKLFFHALRTAKTRKAVLLQIMLLGYNRCVIYVRMLL